MMENGHNEDVYEMEMAEVSVHSSSSDEYSVEIEDDMDSEYGEQTITPQTVTNKSNDFEYRTSVRRQNCCFGLSMISFAGLFIAAYFLMGLSFSPSNIGMFGDESAMKGGSGEVGLDADNAATQEIVDEEILDVEEEMAGTKSAKKRAKRAKREKLMKEFIGRDDVGKRGWVEDKGWWKEHAPEMDTSQMSDREKKKYKRMKNKEMRQQKKHERFCGKNPDHERCENMEKLDLDSIEEKLSQHYNYESTGGGKENYPPTGEGGLVKFNLKRFCRHHPGDEKCQGDYLNLDKTKQNENNNDKVVQEEAANEPVEEAAQQDTGIDNDADLQDIVIKEGDDEQNNNATVDEVTDQQNDNNIPIQDVVVEEEEAIHQKEAVQQKVNANAAVVEEEEMEPEQQTTTIATEATTTVPEPIEIPKVIVDTFIVLEQVGHDKSSFTQGLSYGDDGTLYETTGLYSQSKVRRINPTTFEVEASVDLSPQFFGEGSTFYRDADGNGRLIQITWKKSTGFIYDSETLDQLKEFKYTTTPSKGNQGWGITYDASKSEFIVSDGSHFLYFWDRDTLEEKRKVAVTRFDGREQANLNEIEFMDGLVCCNIWYDDHIICVDPGTGKSVREYDMSSLWPASQRRKNGADVLNGIAIGPDHVLLTGKLWDKMYKVTFPDWPAFAFR